MGEEIRKEWMGVRRRWERKGEEEEMRRGGRRGEEDDWDGRGEEKEEERKIGGKRRIGRRGEYSI